MIIGGHVQAAHQSTTQPKASHGCSVRAAIARDDRLLETAPFRVTNRMPSCFIS